jgi:hypothetical protein
MTSTRLALAILCLTATFFCAVGAMAQPTVAHAAAKSYEVRAAGKTLVCVEVTKTLTVCSVK